MTDHRDDSLRESLSEFEQACRDVRKYPRRQLVPERVKPAPEPVQTLADARRVMDEILDDDLSILDAGAGAGDDMSYLRPGVQLGVLRKLKKGHYCVNVALDLHGMTAPQARQAVTEFCNEAHSRNVHCIRIIHGKGWRSGNRGPVLKPLVGRWLMRRSDVLAFCPARPVDGGTGALYVLLKRS